MDPFNISTLPWNEKTASYKMQTSILFDADKKLIDFGDQAVLKYTTESGKKEFYFFHKFKMLLYHKDDEYDKVNDDASEVRCLIHSSFKIKQHFFPNR